MLGMTPVQANSCVAVWVPVSAGQALAGMMWYNNDGAFSFPSVLVASGRRDYPMDLAEAVSMATDVAAGSSAWSR